MTNVSLNRKTVTPSGNETKNWFKTLSEIETTLNALAFDRVYEFYRLLDTTFSRVVRSDSFYVCLYEPSDPLPLWFVYNMDTIDGNQHWEEPARCSLQAPGEGPTSTVIHTRRPYVLDNGNRAVQNGAINFGDERTVSKSAIHVPLLIGSGTSSEKLLGVISAQSYTENCYASCHVRALEGLADCVGRWLYRSLTPQKKELASPSLSPLTVMELAETLTLHLNELRHTLQCFTRSIPEDAMLRETGEALEEKCRQIQVEAMQLPWRLRALLPLLPQKEKAGLKARHLLVMEALCTYGEQNKVLATRLGIAESTLKGYLQEIFEELGVSNRVQAALRFRERFGKPEG